LQSIVSFANYFTEIASKESKYSQKSSKS